MLTMSLIWDEIIGNQFNQTTILLSVNFVCLGFFGLLGDSSCIKSVSPNNWIKFGFIVSGLTFTFFSMVKIIKDKLWIMQTFCIIPILIIYMITEPCDEYGASTDGWNITIIITSFISIIIGHALRLTKTQEFISRFTNILENYSDVGLSVFLINLMSFFYNTYENIKYDIWYVINIYNIVIWISLISFSPRIKMIFVFLTGWLNGLSFSNNDILQSSLVNQLTMLLSFCFIIKKPQWIYGISTSFIIPIMTLANGSGFSRICDSSNGANTCQCFYNDCLSSQNNVYYHNNQLCIGIFCGEKQSCDYLKTFNGNAKHSWVLILSWWGSTTMLFLVIKILILVKCNLMMDNEEIEDDNMLLINIE